MSRMLTALARESSSRVGQASLAAVPELHDDLAGNPALDAQLWLQMWESRPPAERAVRLAGSPAAQRSARLLSRERRRSVLRALLVSAPVPFEQATELLEAGRIDPQTASLWWDAGTVPPGLESAVAHAAGGEALAQYFTHFPDAPDAGIDAAVAFAQDLRVSTAALAALLDARPTMLPGMLASPVLWPVRLGCQSRHLTDQDVMLAVLAAPRALHAGRVLLASELALNPNAGPQVLEAARVVLTAEPASPAARRALSRIGRYAYGMSGPWESPVDVLERELLVLLADEAVGRREFLAAAGVLPGFPRARSAEPEQRRVTVRSPASAFPREVLLGTSVNGTGQGPSLNELAGLLSTELDALGPEAWETAVSLLGGGFNDEVGVLLDVCRRL
jgi:hypothetical protein